MDDAGQRTMTEMITPLLERISVFLPTTEILQEALREELLPVFHAIVKQSVDVVLYGLAEDIAEKYGIGECFVEDVTDYVRTYLHPRQEQP